MRILVTGGAGFIGSAVCRYLVLEAGDVVLNVGQLAYAGNPESLRKLAQHSSYKFAREDICDRAAMDRLFADFQPDGVLHLAAESHVDRSITGAGDFVNTNIGGTFSLVVSARSYWSQLAPRRQSEF